MRILDIFRTFKIKYRMNTAHQIPSKLGGMFSQTTEEELKKRNYEEWFKGWLSKRAQWVETYVPQRLLKVLFDLNLLMLAQELFVYYPFKGKVKMLEQKETLLMEGPFISGTIINQALILRVSKAKRYQKKLSLGKAKHLLKIRAAHEITRANELLALAKDFGIFLDKTKITDFENPKNLN
jgi:hypothetical protein